jgi:predicted enzyme related to lactoylglutathione lyase
MKPNPFGWIEIPVKDMSRAVAFYNGVFGFDLKVDDLGPLLMAQFPFDHDAPGCPGALVFNAEFYTPSSDSGILVYMECENVKKTLNKMKALGGKIIVPEKQISPEHGCMGVALDSEGNRLAVHAKS